MSWNIFCHETQLCRWKINRYLLEKRSLVIQVDYVCHNKSRSRLLRDACVKNDQVESQPLFVQGLVVDPAGHLEVPRVWLDGEVVALGHDPELVDVGVRVASNKLVNNAASRQLLVHLKYNRL